MSQSATAHPTEYALYDLDADRLDEHVCRQAKLYHEGALRLADARDALERAKSRRDLTEAELKRDIRSEPLRYGLEKATEDAVKSAVLYQPQYRAADRKVHDAKHAAEICQAYVDGLDQQKRMIEKLVDLRLSDYWAEPRLPRGEKRKVEEAQIDKAFGKRRDR